MEIIMLSRQQHATAVFGERNKTKASANNGFGTSMLVVIVNPNIEKIVSVDVVKHEKSLLYK